VICSAPCPSLLHDCTTAWLEKRLFRRTFLGVVLATRGASFDRQICRQQLIGCGMRDDCVPDSANEIRRRKGSPGMLALPRGAVTTLADTRKVIQATLATMRKAIVYRRAIVATLHSTLVKYW